MNTKHLSLLILCSVFLVAVQAQKVDTRAVKNVYLELGGPGFISVNYDQRFKGEKGLGIRGGIGVLPVSSASTGSSSSSHLIANFPVALNYLAGSKGNYAEFGAGVTAVNLTDPTLNYSFDVTSARAVGHLLLGYRYQPVKKGFAFRIFLSPVFVQKKMYFGYGGLSLGLNF